MGLIEKIENAINFILLKLGELIAKAIPKKVKSFFALVFQQIEKLKIFFKELPFKIFHYSIALVKRIKAATAEINFKAVLSDAYQKAMQNYKQNGAEGAGKVKQLFLAPFFIVGVWLKGLTAAQSILLLTFSCASFLSVIGIGFSGQKLIKPTHDNSREPASTEEVLYDRPDYYKKQTKFFEMTSFRLAVYVAEVNEIRSVDLDFTVTMSNRTSKQYLEKHDFQLRDYLILHTEPSVASFPLEEEGKEIIREKLVAEINNYLKANDVEGHVEEVKITYILAN